MNQTQTHTHTSTCVHACVNRYMHTHIHTHRSRWCEGNERQGARKDKILRLKALEQRLECRPALIDTRRASKPHPPRTSSTSSPPATVGVAAASTAAATGAWHGGVRGGPPTASARDALASTVRAGAPAGGWKGRTRIPARPWSAKRGPVADGDTLTQSVSHGLDHGGDGGGATGTRAHARALIGCGLYV